MLSACRSVLLCVGLLAAGAASAQTTPALSKPAEFYFDTDNGAMRPLMPGKETGDAAVEKLMRRIERDPGAKAERAQLAHLAMESGRTELGRELYSRAFAKIERSDGLWRATMWTYAWDLYRAGDKEGALKLFADLQSARSITASWMPPTLALALWSTGRKDEAVQWYAAAVRTEPQQWNTTAAYAKLLPEWRDSERATLAEVHAAWAANPPAWP